MQAIYGQKFEILEIKVRFRNRPHTKEGALPK